ncbi:transcription-repair coupling factor [bacterium]|nr:transcription-repair coupling factor [bacterium]
MADLKSLLERLDSSRAFTRALEHLYGREDDSAAEARLGNLYGSARNFVAAGLQTRRPGTTLYVTRGARQVEKIEADLLNFLPEEQVNVFPQWEVLPYEDSRPEPGIVGPRIEALSRLMHLTPGVTVIPVRALCQRVVAPGDFNRREITLRLGQSVELESLLAGLVELGFRREAMVEEVGTFSVRGGILDIYGFEMENPVRLELFGDELADLRCFEIASQRSVEKLERVRLLPVSEPFDWKRNGVRGGSSRLGDLFDYLAPGSLVLFDERDKVLQEAEKFWEEVHELHERAVERRGALFRAPEELYLSAQELGERLEQFRRADLCSLHIKEGPGEAIRFDTREAPAVDRDLDSLRGHLRREHERGRQSWLLCDTAGQLERLEELLGESAELAVLALGSLETGFSYPDCELVLYTDHEIFRRFRHVRGRRNYKRAPSLENFSSLRPGDYVVHIDYGIGKFRGLKKISTENATVDCLWLEYADGDFLYVPMDQLGLVERYSSEDGQPPAVHKIGGAQWLRVKARTVKAIQDMTEELISIYASRKVRGGFEFSPDTDWQRDLERSFVYEETVDQLRAIEEIKADMQKKACMDRLLCGDVGFGKTEVALRAAFKAVQDGKQVAVLVPTTVLAQQHYITFSERLADFPVQVETLSRFKGPKEQKDIVKRLGKGEVDILIGTHRLLSQDVKFSDLGLLVIDEEQRFGVKHKERLKKIRNEVDTLTMTATPIPRTLHMSLMGIRDLSLITTPPQDRLPIHTRVCGFDEEVIAEAIRRELARDGQVFFVHNRVGSIYAMHEFLHRVVPECRIGVAHGQMPERELESSMRRFQRREVNVLLSTMIIENGLDFPNANTIIVNRADCFGLAQLYQLRGRVGRSFHRAYAYLMVPPQRMLTDDAVKRLRVLEEYTELGSGYEIALRDLEMRGTGNLLGSQQHGFITAVGFDTYLKLLKDAIAKLEQSGQRVEAMSVKVNLDLPAYLPDEYVPDQKQKLALYRKIASSEDPALLDEVAHELEDRFGALPEEVRSLLEKMRLRIFAARLGLESVYIADGLCKLDFSRQARVRLNPVCRALESVSGRKEVLSLDPVSIVIQPQSKQKAFAQITGALGFMAAQPQKFLESVAATLEAGTAQPL